MYPQSLQIYGPFELNGYNGTLIIGICVFAYLFLRHPGREKLISTIDFINIGTESAIAGILGGRALHVLSSWRDYPTLFDMLRIWDGGLSILGALIGVLCYSIWALSSKNISIVATFGIAALYAPLVHAIARVGCFLVGCCYGAPTTAFWGVTYTNPLAFAPLEVKMHPTQLYSSLIYLGLFLVLRFLPTLRSGETRGGCPSTPWPWAFFSAGKTECCSASKLTPDKISTSKPTQNTNTNNPNQWVQGSALALAIYLMGMSAERFIVDFYRGDRIMQSHGMLSILSFHQWVALAIFIATALGLFIVSYTAARARAHESI